MIYGLKPINEYTVVFSRTVAHLVADVNDYIKIGWTPQGGIQNRKVSEEEINYYQAMVKR